MRSKTRFAIDPDRFLMKDLQTSLESRELIPSRVGLKEHIQERFKKMISAGIVSVGDLNRRLKSKDDIADFERTSGVPTEYLILLKREANSYMAKPVALAKIPGISKGVIEILDGLGIRNTKQLFEKFQAIEDRKSLCSDAGIKKSELDELFGLSDLSRLYGVGPAFARMLYDIGIDSVEKFLGFEADEIVRLYESQKGVRADFAAKDIQFSMDAANVLIRDD